MVGELVTKSALMGQRRNPKYRREEYIRICKSHGGLGVVAAHCGTCLGLMFPAHKKNELIAALVDRSSIGDCVLRSIPIRIGASMFAVWKHCTKTIRTGKWPGPLRACSTHE